MVSICHIKFKKYVFGWNFNSNFFFRGKVFAIGLKQIVISIQQSGVSDQRLYFMKFVTVLSMFIVKDLFTGKKKYLEKAQRFF